MSHALLLVIYRSDRAEVVLFEVHARVLLPEYSMEGANR